MTTYAETRRALARLTAMDAARLTVRSQEVRDLAVEVTRDSGPDEDLDRAAQLVMDAWSALMVATELLDPTPYPPATTPADLATQQDAAVGTPGRGSW